MNVAHVKHVEFAVIRGAYCDVPTKSNTSVVQNVAMTKLSELTQEQQDKLSAIVKRTLPDIKDYADLVFSQFRVHDIEETGGCAAVCLFEQGLFEQGLKSKRITPIGFVTLPSASPRFL